MKTNLAALVAGMALVCALSACGGGGDGSSPSAAQPQPASSAPTTADTPSTPKSVLIEAYGDSTTLGWESLNGVGFVTTANEPAILQSKLQAQFGSTIAVDNLGIGGMEASQILNGTGKAQRPWAEQMANSKAQIITLNFGLNDAYYAKVPKKDVQIETPEDYASIMTQLVQIARGTGKQVVLFEPNPTCEPIREPVMQDYVSELRRVARDQNVPLVAEFDAIMQMHGWQSMLTDCLHPSDALYDIKANLELPAISAIVIGYL
ncbi:TPA: SGNH/GDSL hydrolase family protein [Burkholderia vietnamiensis]|nr:SGNH/GDSL hydrolase family protein [Burkholderia vietnamiensis]